MDKSYHNFQTPLRAECSAAVADLIKELGPSHSLWSVCNERFEFAQMKKHLKTPSDVYSFVTYLINGGPRGEKMDRGPFVFAIYKSFFRALPAGSAEESLVQGMVQSAEHLWKKGYHLSAETLASHATRLTGLLSLQGQAASDLWCDIIQDYTGIDLNKAWEAASTHLVALRVDTERDKLTHNFAIASAEALVKAIVERSFFSSLTAVSQAKKCDSLG